MLTGSRIITSIGDKLNAISHELAGADRDFERADADPGTCVVFCARRVAAAPATTLKFKGPDADDWRAIRRGRMRIFNRSSNSR
jgi:hypothetical protein